MDERLLATLDTLPQKPPRSRLEPYGEFIEELRQRGRTYRDIASILAERFQLRVWASTVQRFIRVQTKAKQRRSSERRQFEAQPGQNPIRTNLSNDEVRQRIEALKRRQPQSEPTEERFHYDPSEPLHLSPKSGDKN